MQMFKEQDTALIAAVSRGRNEVACLLARNGASIDRKNNVSDY
jgi:ankyrin repeat protein